MWLWSRKTNQVLNQTDTLVSRLRRPSRPTTLRKGRCKGIAVLFLVFFLTLFLPPRLANACCNPVCCQCVFEAAVRLREHTTEEFKNHRNWMATEFFKNYLLKAMMMMTEQLTTVAMQQMQLVGSMLDAKEQLETILLFQKLQAQAHKDYHTSEELCTIGTGLRSMASSDRKGQYNALALNRHSMQRQFMSGKGSAGVGSAGDKADRIAKFKTTHCAPGDNSGGLDSMCGGGGPVGRRNADVDYTRTIESPLTLDVDFLNGTASPGEEDVLAMQKNLFGSSTFDPLPPSYMSQQDKQEKFMQYRSAVARRNVAENTFNTIVGMKSEGSGGSTAFLAAILKELGMPDGEAHRVLGQSPDGSRTLNASYFAQMEMLTKTFYQNPDFFSNLYDKPTNVARKGVALQALGLMQDRDYFRSQIRSETLMSLLLEMEISKVAGSVQNAGRDLTGQSTPSSNQ